MNNRKAAPGINPPSNPTRPKEPKISIRQTLFLNSQFSILNSLRFVLLCLFLPAISLSIGQVPGMPYGVQGLDCSVPPEIITETIILWPDYITATTTFTASISKPVTGAKSYEWELLDANLSSLSLSGTSIQVTASKAGTILASAIKVKAVNDCGSSATVSLSTSFQVKEPGTSDRSYGKTDPCFYDNKATCTCKKGTPVFYGKANDTQRGVALGYFSNQSSDDFNSWFINNVNTENWTMIHNFNGSWQKSTYNKAVAVCFD